MSRPQYLGAVNRQPTQPANGLARQCEYPLNKNIPQSEFPTLLQSNWKDVPFSPQTESNWTKRHLFDNLIKFATKRPEFLVKVLKFCKELRVQEVCPVKELANAFTKRLQDASSRPKSNGYVGYAECSVWITQEGQAAIAKMQLWRTLADAAEEPGTEHLRDLVYFAYRIGRYFEENDRPHFFRFMVCAIVKGDASLTPLIDDNNYSFLTYAIGWHRKFTNGDYFNKQEIDKATFARSQRITVLMQLLQTLPIQYTTPIVSAFCRLIEYGDRESDIFLLNGVLGRQIVALLNPSMEGKHSHILQILERTLTFAKGENRQIFIQEMMMENLYDALLLLTRANTSEVRTKTQKVLALLIEYEC